MTVYYQCTCLQSHVRVQSPVPWPRLELEEGRGGSMKGVSSLYFSKQQKHEKKDVDDEVDIILFVWFFAFSICRLLSQIILLIRHCSIVDETD